MALLHFRIPPTIAGAILLALQRSKEFTGKALGDQGDSIANAFLMKTLCKLRPDDALLDIGDEHVTLKRPGT